MSDEFDRPAERPPPMFFGNKEKDLVKQFNDELLERIIGQDILYYPIDEKTTDYHPVYGEAIEKNYLSPIQVYALVEWEGTEELASDKFNVDKRAKIMVHFQKRRLTEDKNLYVRVGDFVLYDERMYEIVSLKEPKRLFGQDQSIFDITAECIKARKGLFDG